MFIEFRRLVWEYFKKNPYFFDYPDSKNIYKINRETIFWLFLDPRIGNGETLIEGEELH